MSAPLKTSSESSKPWCRTTAFSLVEILVGVAVLSLLMVLLTPMLRNSIEGARRVQCVQNLKQIATAIMAHASEHNMEIPVDRENPKTGTSWYSPILPYLSLNTTVFGAGKGPLFCPANPASTSGGAAGWTNYAINSNFYEADSSVAPGASSEDSAAAFGARRAVRFPQVNGTKALLIDSFDGESETWYRMSGARHSNPWKYTFPVHGRSINVLFTDGHVSHHLIEPRPSSLSIGGDLVEVKAEWFWPITE